MPKGLVVGGGVTDERDREAVELEAASMLELSSIVYSSTCSCGFVPVMRMRADQSLLVPMASINSVVVIVQHSNSHNS